MTRLFSWGGLAAGAALAGMLLAAGCESPGGTTRFSISDVEFTSAELASSLAGSSFMRERTAETAEGTITVGQFRNISSERIGRADRWLLVSRLLYDPDMLEALRSRGLFVTLPPEARGVFARYAIAEKAGRDVQLEDGTTVFEPAPVEFVPIDKGTHVLNVTFLSASRAEASDGDTDARKDVFVVQAEIVDLSFGEIVWSDQTTFARTARGVLLN